MSSCARCGLPEAAHGFNDHDFADDSDFLTPEEIADLEWESGFSLDEQAFETELAEIQATTQRLNQLARKRSHGTGGRA